LQAQPGQRNDLEQELPMTKPNILADTRNTTAASIWPVLVFALIALGSGLGAMAALAGGVTAGAITALVTAVLGVVGTHAGHVAGHELAARQSPAQPPLPGLERLAQLHTDGELTDDEFTAAKAKLLH
jgi:hypothetical protein